MTYRSKFEKKIASQLLSEGINFEYEVESYSYEVKVLHSSCADCGSTEVYNEKWYTPDFFITDDLVIEAKGIFSAAERKKMIAVRDAHPDKEFRMCFMKDNKIHRKSKTRYSDWCESNNFKYCVGEIPMKWIKEFKEHDQDS